MLFLIISPKHLPKSIQIVDCEEYVEDPAFVRRGVDLLIELIENQG